MSRSTTAAVPLEIGTLVTLAYRKAGLVNIYEELDETRLAAGRLELESWAMSTQSQGLLARETDFELVQLAEGVNAYTLAADVVNVDGAGMYADTDQILDAATSETRVTQIRMEEWQERSTKADTGRPTLFYVNRAADPLELRLFPTPDAAGTIRFQVQRLKRSSLNANDTADFESYATLAIVYGVAYELAVTSSVPMGKCEMLKRDASEHMARYKSMARPHVGMTFRLNHRTPWSR